jgi:hypothetical protein
LLAAHEQFLKAIDALLHQSRLAWLSGRGEHLAVAALIATYVADRAVTDLAAAQWANTENSE